jgi:hypothetical protein
MLVKIANLERPSGWASSVRNVREKAGMLKRGPY